MSWICLGQLRIKEDELISYSPEDPGALCGVFGVNVRLKDSIRLFAACETKEAMEAELKQLDIHFKTKWSRPDSEYKPAITLPTQEDWNGGGGTKMIMICLICGNRKYPDRQCTTCGR